MVEKWDDKDKGERMIMKGKWKTRAMAFVMAFSMGMSSMISSSVYAAAEQPETKVETETQVFEEQTEEKVRAEDIVKDVSDKEFRVETSMEGISYDPERESVLLSEIKDQDGGSFQPENPGVYYAQYLVTPKDGSEPYMIGRTITLTDTEGLAHSESNGGEKQKEDTSSEEDSEQPLPVEITSSQPEDTPDVLAELERDIEEGNVMMLSAADGMGKSETVHLNKGRTIYYPDYLGNYLTCLFTVNGKLAYCLESHRASPPTGDYVADILESNKNLQKVLYYGYGGAGDITGSYLSGKSDDEKYVYTHLAASYAYCGDLAFTGCPYENLVNAGVIAYINHLFGMEEPPKGELSFSNANVTAVREGDIQKTPDITLNGDHRNKITIPVPQGVTGYNKSKGTNVSGGNLEVYGGDTFYLQAPLTVTGKWESGQLYGSVRESWKTLVLTSTGGNNQDIGAFISEKAAPVSFDIQWLNLARVKILKKDAETGNPLDGAVYGVYKNSTCTDQLLTIAMTGEDGISYSDYFDAALETVYVKEITAPNGYAINKTVYPVHVSAGSSVEVEAVNTSVKGKITVKKQDVDGQYVVAETKTPENLKQIHPFLVTVNEDSRDPQEWRVFDDRPFEFMLKIIKKDAETDHNVLNNSATYKIWDFEKKAYVEQMVYYPEKEKISEFSTNADGYLILPEELKAGHYRIEEIQAPDGYVRQGYEEEQTKAIEIVINSDTPHQIDPDTGAYIVEVVQYNEVQTGHLTLQKVGEQLKTVKDENLLEKAKKFFVTLKDMVMGEVSVESGLEKKFIYEESGVEGAVFELHAKETIYTPDGAVDENGNRIIRYEKDALVATLTTDEDGKAEIGELPLGSYYLKETTAGDHFVLNPEQKEFTLSAEDDTVSVVYEGVTYKNERQKIQISVEKKNSVTKEALEGVVFGLYAGEDIKNTQGKVVVEKDTLLETKATDQEGRLTFESDLWHGHYYVKEDQHLPGYLPNDEIWEIDATYEDQNLPAILLEKEVENQPTESYFTKTDIVTGEPVEGAKLQILDEEGTVVREWITTKEEHLEYALPAGNYILHEELPPLEDGYVSAEDVSFEVKEDGTITKVEMKDDFSKVDISKTDITGDTELVGVKLQVLNSKEEVLDEWISDGTEHPIEYLPVGEELTLRETQTISGYTLAEDVKFTLEDTGEVQKVSMKNEFVYGKIFLRKTDLQSGDALAGAEFEIRNKTTNEVAGVLKTDQNGQAESEELLIGSYNEKGIKELFQYEVVETKAPEGYQLDSRPHPVTFDLEGEKDGEILVELDVTNQRIPTDAPKTGDDTVSPMLLLGICAVCTGILIGCFVYRKKKQETDEKEEN